MNIASELNSTIDSARQTFNTIRSATERMGSNFDKIKSRLNSGKYGTNNKKSDEQCCSTSVENATQEEENTKVLVMIINYFNF
jgi:hypothetical protein